MADKKSLSLIEYAGIGAGRDITRGFVGAIQKYLPTTDSLLNLKNGGDLELYESILQDDQVKSCLQQRLRAVISKDWEVLPGGEKRIDKQAAEHLQKQLEAIDWDGINEKMLYGVFYGYSAAEVLWKREDDKVTIADIKVRNRRRFHFNLDQQLVLKTFQNPLGEDLPERKFWHFSTGADHDDEPYGRGLGHWLYWPTFFKRNGVRWWLKFIEKYAKPTRLGKYPAGATQDEKDVLWNALDSFGDDDRSMIPEGLEMLFLESARSGTVDYKALCDQMDGAIAKIILSQTMTTDNGSSKSQAEVHENVADSIIESDADLLCESFNNSVARWLTDWNYPGAAYPQVRRKLEAAPDLGVLADTDTKLQGLGISLKPEAIAARYGEDYLIPENDESIPQLNSEQVNALVSIITNAKQGGWSAELVAGMINGAFPNWPDDAVAAITNNLGSGAPRRNDSAIPVEPVDLDAVAAQFAKKKCSKGISCGDSCIASGKICAKHLTPQRQQQIKNLKKRAKGGDAIAQDVLNELRNRKSREISLREFESSKVNQPFESAMVLNAYGDQVFQKDGGKAEVAFDDDQVASMKDGILTHNHPLELDYPIGNPRRYGTSLSSQDIVLSALADLAEIRAVAPKYVYSMSRPDSGWPDKDSVKSAVALITKERFAQYGVEFGKKYPKATLKDMDDYNDIVNGNYQHEVMTKYAKSIGAKYTRTEHGYYD
jgi:phage gp29-like protein